MRALKCDNCGEFYGYAALGTTKIAFCRDSGFVVSERDLCPECLEAVDDALEDVKMRKRNNLLEDDLK